MSAIITFAPDSASPRTMAAPRPPAAPVTSAVLPSRLSSSDIARSCKPCECPDIVQLLKVQRSFDKLLRRPAAEDSGNILEELADDLLVAHRVGCRAPVMFFD